jgi:hypothetical protein
MRLFEMVGIEDFVLYFFPSMALIFVFAAGLSFAYIRRKNSEDKLTTIIEKFPGGIEGRNAPFPLVLFMIIAGTVIWALGYILFIGLSGIII